MKKAANLVLYLAYAALILAHPHLNQMLREYVAKTFSMTLPMLLAPALYIASPAHPFGGADLYPSKRAHPGGLCGCYDSFAGVLLLPPNELPSAGSAHGDGL